MWGSVEASVCAALVIGGLLGLTGAGGAILLVPLFVYGLAIPAERAAGQSSVVLAAVASLGALTSYRRKHWDGRAFLRYLPGVIVGAWLGRAWIVDALPRGFMLGGSWVARSSYLMILLAAVMVMSATALWRGPRAGSKGQRRFPEPAIGLVVGLMTGVLGAGGGFLFVPALILLSGLGPEVAAGTSLGLVAAGTLVAGTTELARHSGEVRWPVFAAVTGATAAGLLLGVTMRSKVTGGTLSRAMAVVILMVAVWIVLRESATIIAA